MNELPTAVRATAAALAVFMTTATLNWLIAIAEPQQSELMAQMAARQGTQTGAVAHVTVVAEVASATTQR
ncbi:MAG TPA: hypothetical protein VFU71_21690 [Burkholderiaceae bacterium]|nr:hypothetical protein [Burkholderiaceae bacterium]